MLKQQFLLWDKSLGFLIQVQFLFFVVLYTFWSFLLTENRQMMNILQYKFEKSCLRNKTKMQWRFIQPMLFSRCALETETFNLSPYNRTYVVEYYSILVPFLALRSVIFFYFSQQNLQVFPLNAFEFGTLNSQLIVSKEMARKGHTSAFQSKNNEWAFEMNKNYSHPLSHLGHVFALCLISHNWKLPAE